MALLHPPAIGDSSPGPQVHELTAQLAAARAAVVAAEEYAIAPCHASIVPRVLLYTACLVYACLMWCPRVRVQPQSCSPRARIGGA